MYVTLYYPGGGKECAIWHVAKNEADARKQAIRAATIHPKVGVGKIEVLATGTTEVKWNK